MCHHLEQRSNFPVAPNNSIAGQLLRWEMQALRRVFAYPPIGLQQDAAVGVGEIEVLGKRLGIGHVFMDEPVAQLSRFQPGSDIFHDAESLRAIEYFDLAAGLLAFIWSPPWRKRRGG